MRWKPQGVRLLPRLKELRPHKQLMTIFAGYMMIASKHTALKSDTFEGITNV